jgi:hypothetical protein
MKVTLDSSGLTAREAQLVHAVLAAHERTLQLQFLTFSLYKLSVTLGQKMGAGVAPVVADARDLETFLVEEMASFARAAFPDLEIRVDAANGATNGPIPS